MATYSCHEQKKLGTSCCIDLFAVLRGKHVQEYLFWYQDMRSSAEHISKLSSWYAPFSMFTFHIYGFQDGSHRIHIFSFKVWLDDRQVARLAELISKHDFPRLLQSLGTLALENGAQPWAQLGSFWMTGKPENVWRSALQMSPRCHILSSCSLRFSIILLAIE